MNNVVQTRNKVEHCGNNVEQTRYFVEQVCKML